MQNENNEFVTQENDTEKTDNQLEETSEENEETSEETSELDELRKRVQSLEAQKEHWRKKASKPEVQTNTASKEQKPITNTLTREEAILIAQGYDESALDNLQKVASVTGKNLREAQNDPLFQAWYKDYQREQKEEKARLGASKGSTTVKSGPTLGTPGLSDEEHKRLWRESQSK